MILSWLTFKRFLPVIQEKLKGAGLIWPDGKDRVQIACNDRRNVRLFNRPFSKFFDQPLVQGFDFHHIDPLRLALKLAIQFFVIVADAICFVIHLGNGDIKHVFVHHLDQEAFLILKL